MIQSKKYCKKKKPVNKKFRINHLQPMKNNNLIIKTNTTLKKVQKKNTINKNDQYLLQQREKVMLNSTQKAIQAWKKGAAFPPHKGITTAFLLFPSQKGTANMAMEERNGRE